MNRNAGYCYPQGLCCFSMIRSEEPEALVAIGKGIAICQHHLYMAFMRLVHGVPARPARKAKSCNSEDQLGLELLGFSRIADGSDMPLPRPRAIAVGDF